LRHFHHAGILGHELEIPEEIRVHAQGQITALIGQGKFSCRIATKKSHRAQGGNQYHHGAFLQSQRLLKFRESSGPVRELLEDIEMMRGRDQQTGLLDGARMPHDGRKFGNVGSDHGGER